ncbi:uncharacterized protein FIBRA_07096 [Fibroporia radiculosa]|uniref:F-box domain-containing protein n=1 Tax=Fibroporia radiculosa TaxID=599839 RepID=J4GUC3_9APHY|nr:uncharacterized protein FIBRA_07096 [Fibroporia radiculosa]CCM04900.1 predicted protein [Fibroporia radiculosa]
MLPSQATRIDQDNVFSTLITHDEDEGAELVPVEDARQEAAFPLEIFEHIIDQLHPSRNVRTLRSCSLVCKAFVHGCRKRLFASIRISDNFALQRLVDMLQQPHLAPYLTHARELYVDDPNARPPKRNGFMTLAEWKRSCRSSDEPLDAEQPGINMPLLAELIARQFQILERLYFQLPEDENELQGFSSPSTTLFPHLALLKVDIGTEWKARGRLLQAARFLKKFSGESKHLKRIIVSFVMEDSSNEILEIDRGDWDNIDDALVTGSFSNLERVEIRWMGWNFNSGYFSSELVPQHLKARFPKLARCGILRIRRA